MPNGSITNPFPKIIDLINFIPIHNENDTYLLMENDNPYIIDKNFLIRNDFKFTSYENKRKPVVLMNSTILIENTYATFERINFTFCDSRESSFLHLNSLNIIFKV